MNNFLTASRLKLRIPTNKGLLTVEQLWDLTTTSLIDLEDNLKELVEKGENKLSRRKRVVKSKEQFGNELILSIVTEILDIKEKEEDEAKDVKANKEHNEKIAALIAKKQESNLELMTIDELKALMK